jgi:hypothetical protein
MQGQFMKGRGRPRPRLLAGRRLVNRGRGRPRPCLLRFMNWPWRQCPISPIEAKELWFEPIMSCAETRSEATTNRRTRMSALLQSQRDWVRQPRVARHELPWGGIRTVFNPNGVASPNPLRTATPLGLFDFCRVSQGSSCLANLGFEPESLWDSSLAFPQGTEAKPGPMGGCNRRRSGSRG